MLGFPLAVHTPVPGKAIKPSSRSLSRRARHTHPGDPRKLLELMNKRNPGRDLPSPSTAMRILSREGLVQPRRRHRWAHPGCPKSVSQGPNDIWVADYKG